MFIVLYILVIDFLYFLKIRITSRAVTVSKNTIRVHGLSSNRNEAVYCKSYEEVERVKVFNATFNNISAISWRSVLLVEETGVLEKNSCCIE